MQNHIVKSADGVATVAWSLSFMDLFLQFLKPTFNRLSEATPTDNCVVLLESRHFTYIHGMLAVHGCSANQIGRGTFTREAFKSKLIKPLQSYMKVIRGVYTILAKGLNFDIQWGAYTLPPLLILILDLDHF